MRLPQLPQRQVRPTTEIKVKRTGRIKHVPAQKFRPSLGLGRICILLAGPYKGKRVVVLKTLPSGFIVITGPYYVNGIPVRRAHPRYVLATSMKLALDESRIDLSKFDDAYFAKKKSGEANKKEKEPALIDPTSVPPRNLPEEKKADQKVVDDVIVKSLERSNEPLLKQYLKTRFTLRDRMYPHALVF